MRRGGVSVAIDSVAPSAVRRVHGEARALLPPELAFLVAEGLAPERLVPAAKIALSAGVTGEAALFGLGVSDDLYYRLLARHLGAAYLERPLRLSPLRFDRETAATVGAAPLAPNAAGWARVEAPRGLVLRRLLRLHRGSPHRAVNGVITTPRRFEALLRRHDESALLERASDGLANWDATLSARGCLTPMTRAVVAAGAGVAGLATATAPVLVGETVSTLLYPLCAAFVAQRLVAAAAGSRHVRDRPIPRALDRDLPVYTILVPLFREAAVLPRLVAALMALDYPAAKLDIKLLLEADDHATIRAAVRLNLPSRFELVVLQPGHPRTKARALNAGLASARGDFVVVWDAEDRPESLQLRAAVSLFWSRPGRVACVQARLAIDHASDRWITRMFAFEYAGLFGLVIPGLARLGLPVPLGGTSNHFRRDALLRVGGWDAWNVTEDVDLGFRLARFGYEVEALDATTFEEAPLSLAAWLPQRSRWLKGWMMTLIVCIRNPVRLGRELGVVRCLSMVVMLLGTLVTALLGPPLSFFAGFELLRACRGGGLGPVWLLWLGLVVAGVVAFAWPIAREVRRSDARDLALVWMLTLPLYMACISVAAWRAVFETWSDPQAWNKTEHGLASSRDTPAAEAMRNRHRAPR